MIDMGHRLRQTPASQWVEIGHKCETCCGYGRCETLSQFEVAKVFAKNITTIQEKVGSAPRWKKSKLKDIKICTC